MAIVIGANPKQRAMRKAFEKQMPIGHKTRGNVMKSSIKGLKHWMAALVWIGGPVACLGQEWE